MLPGPFLISRRTFLKLQAIGWLWLVGLGRTKAVSSKDISVTITSAPYGKGGYGTGIYPGNQKIYLPLINKEGN